MDSCKETYETDACELSSVIIGAGLIAGSSKSWMLLWVVVTFYIENNQNKLSMSTVRESIWDQELRWQLFQHTWKCFLCEARMVSLHTRYCWQMCSRCWHHGTCCSWSSRKCRCAFASEISEKAVWLDFGHVLLVFTLGQRELNSKRSKAHLPSFTPSLAPNMVEVYAVCTYVCPRQAWSV